MISQPGLVGCGVVLVLGLGVAGGSYLMNPGSAVQQTPPVLEAPSAPGTPLPPESLPPDLGQRLREMPPDLATPVPGAPAAAGAGVAGRSGPPGAPAASPEAPGDASEDDRPDGSREHDRDGPDRSGPAPDGLDPDGPDADARGSDGRGSDRPAPEQVAPEQLTPERRAPAQGGDPIDRAREQAGDQFCAQHGLPPERCREYTSD